ncbi:RNA dependent RNA polymerase-domain-containing protein [Gymnopilus junonius]|uniref:RNA-dependent RNA polymerase n=1 Tax=Gymnopilus junonius TaxID=109634 RepID=A0A9P5NZ10_GYMJU|nr:RNA dependent RNA polymerase-domain-containing protein [Gymnopilus junonius]
MSQQRNNYSGYSTAGNVESSSDAARSDASWVILPAGKGKTSSHADISSTPRTKNDRHRLATAISSISTPTSTSKHQRHHHIKDSATNSGSSTNLPASPKTPSKSNSTSSSTPGSRLNAIENALKEMSLDGTSTASKPAQSPTISQVMSPKKVVVNVIDSDEDETGTDIESSQVIRPPALTADSSLSSMNSLFSQRSATSSSSSLDISSSESQSKRSSQNSRPVVIQDVFHSGHSPHVTTRKKQRVVTKPPVAVSTQPNSQVSIMTEERVPTVISQFARSQFGADLEPDLIAHDDETQRLMDSLMIEWGTQYELARGVSQDTWTWADVRAHLQQLKGKNVDSASKVQIIMRGKHTASSSATDIYLWKELDREQLAIMENHGRGLGLMGDWEGAPDWYGGQVQQVARLVKEVSSYKIKLEPMEKRRSYRYARMFGSRRFIHLKISKELLRNENAQVKQFLLQKFIICGRTYIPFSSKEQAIYMFETNDNWGRSPQDWCGDGFRISFQEFINWHNPLEQRKNYSQVISKWSTRFVLGLSNSVPALEFEEKNIFFIDDTTVSDWPKDKKPPADKLMTDGCGFINHTALYRIVKYMGYESMPAGIQGRIDGSKGFWILHPTDSSEEPKIWIRDSQNKIKNHGFDRAHRIFDLLGPSRPSPSIALTSQSIVNVFANGIPSQILVRLMEEGLEKEVGPLLDWDRPHAAVFLWDAVNKCGNVTGSRTQRVATALNRALGLKGRDWGTEENETDTEDDDNQQDAAASANAGRNKFSGSPASLNELTVEMIQAGFMPSMHQYLYEKIGYVVQNVIKSSVEKFRIPIEESLGGYVVPDPLGVLEEGEIYYKFSRPRTDPKTGLLLHVLEGEVILGRYPIRLPSDMRRVKAVDKRELDRWPDVIIISIKGKRSLANELAGGDELIVIWDQEIVEAFDNKPFTNEPDNFIEDNFEPSGKVEKVENFCIRTKTMSPRKTSEAFLEHLIANLNESQVGLYSMMHENATVTYGYGHQHSVRLAYIFATLLDSSKTGHRLKAGILQQDLQKFGNKFGDNAGSPPPNDILGRLKVAGSDKGNELLARYKKGLKNEIRQDKDLLLPYNTAAEYALAAQSKRNINVFNEELKSIRSHVNIAYEIFHIALQQGKKGKSSQNDLMIPCARAYAQPLESEIILTRDVEKVKASYAYQLSETFGFSVAFTELCHIKAIAASGGHAPTLRVFDEAKTFSSAFLRALSRSNEDVV